jgi:hypothetical protein
MSLTNYENGVAMVKSWEPLTYSQWTVSHSDKSQVFRIKYLQS